MSVPSPVPERVARSWPSPQSGLSLLELIVAIVIIGIGVAGVFSVFSASVRGSADPLLAKQALSVAEALLEEVQLAAFTYCRPNDPKYVANPNFQAAGSGDCTAGFVEVTGPEAGDVRPFDNVNDYHGLSLASISDVSGAPVPGLAGYSAAITVADAALGTIAAGAGEALHITVAVTAPDGKVYAVDGYRARHSPNAMP